MSEAGWLEEAASILLQCRCLLKESSCPKDWLKLLELYQRLLHVQNGYCEFKSAGETFTQALELAENLQTLGHKPNLAVLYSEFSTLFMLQSDYSKAYSWSVKSLEQLVPNMYQPALVDVLRQSAKSCVLKREFKKAGLLIQQAFKIARGMIGERNLKYADTLIDFGFYLLNVDAISQGIEVYQMALNVRQSVFGHDSRNLHVAIAHEDLSYASYVFNYSNGLFQDARNQAEKALSLLLCLLPKNHLLLSSCKRVKALILEEMAIENPDKEREAKYLEEAHSLHSEALQLALEAFGEMNVQTAKHYGNLGRLYQSMKRFKSAEKMHLKAIQIKEALLGPDDYEVALSVGHLASLYNYDLEFYMKAEKLYLRSIHIGKKLFGEAYSGLEYDYRGLLRVYKQYDMQKHLHYLHILSCWKTMRERIEETSTSPFNDLNEPLGIELTIQQFMAL
ncbi:UNVERIFIED_CONTAM: hypothetical protein GTU68_025296 [Idotea baltica]|nr:hypothetical protein [Idotea baltica]